MVLSLILKYICQKLRKNISGQWSGLPSARPWILCQDYMYLLKCVFSKQICILIIRNLEWQIFGFPESFKLFYNEDKSCKYSWFPWCFTCLNFTLNGYIFFSRDYTIQEHNNDTIITKLNIFSWSPDSGSLIENRRGELKK